MKPIIKVATLLSLSAATLLASGYRIPEQSLNSTALSAAYVAGANGADASYYNPANMALMGGGAEIETAITYINLPKVQYTDSALNPNPISADAESKEEHFIMPTMHYISPMMGNWRYGLSIVAPGGLSKRWDEAYQMLRAEEFSLKVVEVNPTASYKFTDEFAIGFGLRGVYSDGTIKLRDSLNITGLAYQHEMKADSIDFGYNLAMSYKPAKDLTFAATYRSKIDLTVDGEITGSSLLPGAVYPSSVKTQVPLPASLVLASAYTMDKTTVEFVFERTYWSAYDKLDFDFTNAALEAVFGVASQKQWKDVNAYRIGVTHQYSDTLKLMAGFAIDKNPIPDNRVSFELPDSDAKLYSVGFEYKLDKQMSIGMAYLYDDKESRAVSNAGVVGEFTDSAAHLVTASFKYKF